MNGNGTVEADLQEAGQHQLFSIAKILWTSSILWAILWRNFQESLILRCLKEELTKKGLFGQLFNEFYAFLEENNLILHEGTMIDGSFVEAPRQHNTREENKIIKEDRDGELWNPEEGDTEEEKRRKANKKRQKDTDARWVKKGGEKHFGYKNHTKVDKGSKFIKEGVTTDASVHDSKPVKELVDENDRGEDLFADSAYIGKGVKRVMR